MNELDRDLGRVEGKIDLMIDRLAKLEEEMKSVVSFKWQLIGISTGISTIAGFLTRFI